MTPEPMTSPQMLGNVPSNFMSSDLFRQLVSRSLAAATATASSRSSGTTPGSNGTAALPVGLGTASPVSAAALGDLMVFRHMATMAAAASTATASLPSTAAPTPVAFNKRSESSVSLPSTPAISTPSSSSAQVHAQVRSESTDVLESESTENGVDVVLSSAASPTSTSQGHATVDSNSPPTSRSSSRSVHVVSASTINGTTPAATTRAQRKLNIYTPEQKVDIIDYAKVIGNRAAGREYSVAESSIREWRKNEGKLRNQLENTKKSTSADLDKDAFFSDMRKALVDFINGMKDGDTPTWTMIRDRCQQIWSKSKLYNENLTDMRVNGWVARFITEARKKREIPDITPPVTSPNTLNGNGSMPMPQHHPFPTPSISMVTAPSAIDGCTNNQKSESSPSTTKTTTMTSMGFSTSTSNANANSTSTSRKRLFSNESSAKSSSLESAPKSRRKSAAPRRLTDATVVMSNGGSAAGSPVDNNNVAGALDLTQTTSEVSGKNKPPSVVAGAAKKMGGLP